MTLKSKTDTIQTPTGTFPYCYRFHHYIDSGNYYDEWFAPGVGIVQRNTMLMSERFEAKIIDYSVSTVHVDKSSETSPRCSLFPVYPNPSNPGATIKYEIPQPEYVRLDVFDVHGKIVRTLVNGHLAAGVHSADFDGVDDHGATLPAGLYFVRLVAGENVQIKKASLVK